MSNRSDDKKNFGKEMGRREFFRMSGLAVSGLALSPFLGGTISSAEACSTLPSLENYNPVVSSIWVPKNQEAAYYNQFKAMIHDITDFSWLSRGDKVMLKLALNSGSPFPASTDPWLLECMIKLLLEKGVTASNIIVGDQSGVEYVVRTEDAKRGSSRSECESSGLLDIMNKYGVTSVFFEELVDKVGFDNAYTRTYPVNSHIWPKPVYVTSYLNDVDHLIYLPRVASHLIADITSGLKLGIGFLRNDSRLVLHQGGDYFYALYEEVNHIPQIHDKLRLIASSGRSVLRTRGPDRGDVVTPDYGLVFASDDLLAHEILAYSWLKCHDHRRSALSPSTVNMGLINAFFIRVPGRVVPIPSIPELDSDNPYCHPAVEHFMAMKGGRPNSVIWNSLNANPDSTVTATIENYLGMV